MGAFIEINDTLRISKAQGFPEELKIETHKTNAFHAEDFQDKIFSFQNKPSVRIYQVPPVRCFLVEDVDGKWLYWGLCHILELTIDYMNKTTSGKFKIIHLNSVEDMKKAYELIDRNPNNNYFAD